MNETETNQIEGTQIKIDDVEVDTKDDVEVDVEVDTNIAWNYNISIGNDKILRVLSIIFGVT